MDIGDCAFGVADGGGGSQVQERRPEGVFQLPGDQTPKPLWQSLLKVAGEKSPLFLKLDSRVAEWFSSWL